MVLDWMDFVFVLNILWSYYFYILLSIKYSKVYKVFSTCSYFKKSINQYDRLGKGLNSISHSDLFWLSVLPSNRLKMLNISPSSCFSLSTVSLLLHIYETSENTYSILGWRAISSKPIVRINHQSIWAPTECRCYFKSTINSISQILPYNFFFSPTFF